MESKAICNFDLFQDTDSEAKFNEIINHLQKCTNCRNLYMQFSQTLDALNFRNKTNIEFETDINVDIFSNWSDVTNEDIRSFINWTTIKNNQESYRNISTPEYLKRLVSTEFEKSIDSKFDRIILKIHDKIEVIGNYLDNLVINSGTFEVVPTRGDSKTRNGNVGAVEFFQKFDEDEVIQYHVIQDGPDSVLLTIKMENFSFEPEFLGLRSNNKLISSKPFDKNFVNFPRLGPGDYQIEASFEKSKAPIYIPITIVT